MNPYLARVATLPKVELILFIFHPAAPPAPLVRKFKIHFSLFDFVFIPML